MEIKVGQVWETDAGLVMVSSEPVGLRVWVGRAKKRGSSYAITGKPAAVNLIDLRSGRFVADTERGEISQAL